MIHERPQPHLARVCCTDGTDAHHLASLLKVGARPELLSLLQAGGFQRYRRHRTDFAAQMQTLTDTLLPQAGDSAIDAVILCSESAVNGSTPPGAATTAPRELFLDHVFSNPRLAQAYPYIAGYSACANLAAALDIAGSLIRGGMRQHVVILFYEAVLRDEDRISAGRSTVYSDLSAATLVSAAPAGAPISCTVTLSAPELFRTRKGGDRLKQWAALRQALQRLDEALEKKAGIRLRKFPAVICDNIHSGLAEIVATVLQLDRSKLMMPSQQGLGHAFSMDCLVSMSAIPTDQLTRMDTVALLNIGQWSLGVTVLGNPAATLFH